MGRESRAFFKDGKHRDDVIRRMCDVTLRKRTAKRNRCGDSWIHTDKVQNEVT